MTALFIAQLGSFDFADYVRVGASDGLDPYGKGWAEPQFAESAFGAGRALTGVTVGNREMVWPLYLNRNFLLPGDDLTPEETLLMEQHIHELVVDMNRAIAEPNLQLQWCDAHAPAITYYDVAYARFDPEYNYRQDQFGWKAGTLRVWCNPPYGHTGTHRVVGTTGGGSAAVRIPIASNLSGDVPAALDVSVRRGGAEVLAAPGRSIAVAAVPSGVHGLIPAASMVAGDNATITSGALRYTDSFSGIDAGGRAQVHLAPGSAYAGKRMRVLAVAEPNSRSGLRVQASRDGKALGAAQLATTVGGRALLDLGPLDVPALDTRATQTLDLLMTCPVGSLLYGNAAANGVLPGVHALMVAPEDSLSLVRDAPGAVVAFDDTRVASPGNITSRRDTYGNEWTDYGNRPLIIGSYTDSRLDNRGFTASSPHAIGNAAANVLNHRPLEDMTVSVGISADSVRTVDFDVYKQVAAPLAAGATDTIHVAAALHYCGQGVSSAATGYLTLWGLSDATVSVIGSLALPSLAPIAGAPAVLQLSQRGEDCEARLYAVSGSCVAACSGSFPGIDRPGKTLIDVSPASGAHANRILDVEVTSVPSSLMSPTDTYRVASGAWRSHPSYGFSGEVPVVGAQPQVPVDAAAIVVAVGGHALGDAPSVNDVTIRAQERFNLAR